MNPIELSFEFFPPKTQEGVDKLRATRAQLALLKPKFVSVTFGAGGSTQQGTLDTVIEMSQEGFEVSGFWSAFFGSILYSIVPWLLSALILGQRNF